MVKEATPHLETLTDTLSPVVMTQASFANDLSWASVERLAQSPTGEALSVALLLLLPALIVTSTPLSKLFPVGGISNGLRVQQVDSCSS